MPYFDFTLGPVQDFVSQARRTRDFWGGSFLLSWLSAVAMQSVKKQCPQAVLLPEANENFLAFVRGEQHGQKPTQGCVPNHFRAEVHEKFNGQLVVEDVRCAWEALAKKVYEQDLKAYLKDKPASQIVWQRQVANFWDINWILAPEKSTSVTEQRKFIRSYLPAPEPGLKCMMMSGWQELSGIETPHSEALSTFWQHIQKEFEADFREGECLSALGFIKRRFVYHFEKINVRKMPGGWRLKGWQLPSAVPSVSFMAATHWLGRLLKVSEYEKHYDLLKTFRHEAKTVFSYWEKDNVLPCLKNAKGERKWTTYLDGETFFESALQSRLNKTSDEKQAEKLEKVIKALNDVNNQTHVDPPSPFYAILLMDGDNLGNALKTEGNDVKISRALAKFTDEVKEHVEDHCGFLIYAGGDDVLAFLPLENALACADTLQQFYKRCFEQEQINSTLSAAIQFAHIRTPLTHMLHNAHDLLDNVAKDQTGRDSVAVRVWKNSGLVLEWSMPWALAKLEAQQGLIIEQSLTHFRSKNGYDPLPANQFFYRIRDLFNILEQDVKWFSENNPEFIEEQERQLSLLAAEYKQSRLVDGTLSIEDAKAHIKGLLSQCRLCRRIQKDDGQVTYEYSHSLRASAAFLVRFLAKEGIWLESEIDEQKETPKS